MKFVLSLILFLLPAAYALDIGLSVENLLSVDVLYFSYNDTTSTKSFSTELLNSGSLPYYAQVRVDIFSQNRIVFTGWSDKKRLMPGNNGFFRLFWISENSGDYRARLRVYHGNEIEERWLNISATNMTIESAFDITYTRVFDRYIEFSVEGNSDKIVVMPVYYPGGWIFVQQTGRPGRFIMPYSAPGLDRGSLMVYIAAENGGYLTKKEIALQKERGIDAALRNFAFAALGTI